MIDNAYRPHQCFRFPSRRAMRNHIRMAAPARPPDGRMQFSSYQTEGFYDEMFQEDGTARPHFQLVQEIIQSLSDGQLLRYKHAAERLLLQLGITFNVYGDTAGTERIFPFDLIPRIIPAPEWDRIERGLKQRIHALNSFIDDIYHDQKILKDGAIPAGSGHLRRLLPQAVPWPQPAMGRVVPCHRHGPGPRQRRRILCARGQPARTLGRLLRAGESGSAQAHFPRRVRRSARTPGQRVPEPSAGNAGEPGAAPDAARRASWC